MSYPAYSAQIPTRWHEIDRIPAGWEARRLKFLASCNDEALPDRPGDKTLTFEKAPSRARRLVKDGDTIISTVRTYLKAIAPIESPPANMVVSTGFAVIRALEFMDRKYLGYALQNVAFIDAVVANSTGVSYPAINPTALVCLSVSYPKDKAKQQQIAAFLDWKTSQIDALIAKKKELLQKLKEKRLAVITQAVTKGLNPDAPMRDSGIACLGVVPVHWKISPIKSALQEPITDGPHETPEFFDDGIPFVSAESVKNDRLDFDKKRGDISLEDHQRYSKKYHPKRGDVYMVKSGATTGNIARVETDLDFNIWSPLAALRPDLDTVTTDFIFFFMKSKPFFYSVEQGWSFGTQQNIGMGVIANLQMAYPSVAEQKMITKQIDRQTNKIDSMSASCVEAITRLTEYRTALITAATTGKIDVRNWQATQTTT
ncbi:MAG: restriction endonuclease subunit S [Comamonadaceae bacterium]|nr:restriction endonuclease subunit S [Comamonadaceae bacterium]